MQCLLFNSINFKIYISRIYRSVGVQVLSFSVHRAKDSYLSWGSGFQHFEGVMNWAFLMLALGGIRLFLENFNK